MPFDPSFVQIPFRPDGLFLMRPRSLGPDPRSVLLHLLVWGLLFLSTNADFFCEDEIGVTALDLRKEQGED